MKIIPHVVGVDGVERKRCSICKEYQSLDQFAKRKVYRDGLLCSCLSCGRRLSRERYRNDNGTASRDCHLRDTYGITLDQYAAMLEQQNGVCAICHQPETQNHKSGSIKSLCVDHCHASGKVRGLLCHVCNSVLGRFLDDTARLRRAADYLDEHGS